MSSSSSHLETAGTASPTAGGASILGVFDGGTLLGACWAGANLVPIELAPELAGLIAMAAHRSGRRYASIFGPAETVLALYAALEQLGQTAHEVRGPPAPADDRGAARRPARARTRLWPAG